MMTARKALAWAAIAGLTAGIVLQTGQEVSAAGPADTALLLSFEGNATDGSSAHVPVTLHGNPGYAQGKIGQAMQFASAGQYADLGSTASTTFGSTTDFSVAFWIKTGAASGDPVIIGNKNWNSGANAGWLLAMQSGGAIKLNYTPTGKTRTDITTSSSVSDNQWHFIALTVDRDGSASLYKDGQLSASASIAGQQGVIDTAYSTKIGQDGTGAYGQTLNASLDEMRVYKRSLSVAELASLYQDGQTPTSADLKFNGNLTDSSASGLTVTAQGNPGYVAGKVGQALQFSAAGQYADLGNTAATTFGSATDFTVSYWIRTAGAADDPVIIGNKNWSSGSNPGWVMALQSNGSIKWNYTPSGKSRTDAYIPGVADNQWHFIAVSHDRDGLASMYKDGQLVTTASIAAQQGNIDTGFSTRIAQDATGIYSQTLNAAMDELKIYKSSLSASEIKALFDKDQPATFHPNKVLVIGIDGSRPDAVQAANMPNLDALVADGAYAWTAQANANYTWSATGWSTMHTGVWYAKHGVTDNSWANKHFDVYPSLMKRAEQYDPTFTTTSISHWADINTQLVDGIDTEINPSSDADVAAQAANTMATTSADFTFLQFDDVDHAGHTYGFSPTVPQYVSALETVDGQIGTVVNAVKARSTYAQENWLILVSTDHGGTGTSHGGSSVQERTIFFIASGPDAAKGQIQAAVNQTDVMVTALHHLGVPINAAWNLDGKSVGLTN